MEKKRFSERVLLRDVLSSITFFILLLLADFGLRSMHQDVAVTHVFAAVPWLFSLSWALIFTAAVRLLPCVGRRIATGVIGGFYWILFLVHNVLLFVKGHFFSFSSMIFAGDGFKFLDVSYLQVASLTWVLLVIGIVLIVLSILFAPSQNRCGRRIKIECGVSAAVIALCIAGVFLNRELNLKGRTQIHYDIHQSSLIYDDFSDSNESLMLAGLYQYTFRDFSLTYGVYDWFSRAGNKEKMQELDAWYSSKPGHDANEMTGIFKDKNVIMIQLEAIDTWMIDPRFMPNLYELQQQSVQFTKHYTPIYSDAGTFNTEMIVNTGLVPPFIGATAAMYSRNAYPYSLAALMKNAGYIANSFHRSGGDVYNRAVIHENWGYSHYYSGGEMGIERLDYDEELMRAYDTITSGDKFFSFIITYSAHGPYQQSGVSLDFYDWAKSLLPEGTNEMMIHAYARAHETDLFIGEMRDRLKADGLLDNTVLVFYGDHYNYYTLDAGLIMEQKNESNTNLITRTPFFIYHKGTPAQTVDKVTFTPDVLPTLVNMLGLDQDSTVYVGNDAFSDGGGYVIFDDYAWYDGNTYYQPGDAQTPEIAARNEEIRTRLKMSWNTMKFDYFAKK